MVLTNTQLLQRLDSSFKAITEVSDLGTSVLQPEKLSAFVREMELAARILAMTRRETMMNKQKDIDRISLSGRVIRSGKDAAGDHIDLVAGTHGVVPSFATNSLITNELVAVVSLRDDTLRENIERGSLEQTLLELFGSAAGRDMEEYAIFGDTNVAFSDDDVLSLSDGWLRLAAQKLYGVGGDQNFDPAGGTFPEDMFQAAIDAMPKEYMNNPDSLRFFVDYAVDDGYRDLLKGRGTQLGDVSQTQRNPVFYKGIRVEYIPMLQRTPTMHGLVDDDEIFGRASLLANPNNLVWGVFHQVQIEPEREAKARRTDFVLTFEADMHYEDENAAVAALIEAENPAP